MVEVLDCKSEFLRERCFKKLRKDMLFVEGECVVVDVWEWHREVSNMNGMAGSSAL